MHLTATESFEGDVTLSIANVPAGAMATFADNPIAPGGATTLTISNTNAVAAGAYTLDLEGTDGTNTTTNSLTLITYDGVPIPTTLSTPSLGAVDVSTLPVFEWDAEAGVTYDIEIATDNNFTNTVITATNLTGGTFQSSILSTETMYFWRVKGKNLCGDGNFTGTYFFTTANIFCAPTASVDVPVAISDGGANTVTSTIEVTAPGSIEDLGVLDLVVEHTYISDLAISLTSPAGTTVVLYNGQTMNCGEDDLALNFDDEATTPYATLQSLCNGTSPAAGGTFQPAEALAAFNGEMAQGTWTLTINDGFGFDGGALIGWNLDICSIIADDFSFLASPSTLQSCLMDAVTFDITIGGAFDDANGVTLSPNNLPMGATASFSENPANPGSVVTVTLENVTQTGGFSIEIIGNDGINPAASANLIWNIFGPPAATTAVNPTDNAMDEPLTIVMEWDAIPGASMYNYVIATDPDFNNVITSFSAINNSFLQNNLAYGTTYYWTVTAVGDCGETTSEVFEFTTFPDLWVDVSPNNQTICVSDEATMTLNIGPGFETATITANNIPGSATVAYSMNPASGGSMVMVTIGNLVTVMPGTYTVDFTVEDDNGTTMVSANFTVESSPVLTSLQLPENGADMIPVDNQTFSWAAIADVTGYLFEISLNEAFTQVVESNTTIGTSYTLQNQLDNETVYYWRVTATNDCGSSVSLAFNFTSDKLDATYEIFGVAVTLQPNPTRDFVNIVLSAPLNEKIAIDVYAINGQLLQTATLDGNVTHHQIDLSNYSAGVYLVKMVTRDVAIVERVVLEK